MLIIYILQSYIILNCIFNIGRMKTTPRLTINYGYVYHGSLKTIITISKRYKTAAAASAIDVVFAIFLSNSK